MQKEDQELAKQGLIKKSEVFYIKKAELVSDKQDLASGTLSINSINAQSTSASAYDYAVYNVREYVETGDLGGTSAGLQYWLQLPHDYLH